MSLFDPNTLEFVLGEIGRSWDSGRGTRLDPTPLSALGDPAFLAAHGLRYPVMAGAMANGIASESLVEAMGRAGMLGSFGAAGLAPSRVERAIDRLSANLGGGVPYAFNLIHSPKEPDLEEAVADLFLRRGVRLVEASAYLGLTPAVVRYRVTGLRSTPDGGVSAPNRIIAKVSRVEVAEKFLRPAPEKILGQLRERGQITEEEARLAARIPMAEDLTAEADSGGHTDNQPAIVLLPTLMALRDRIQAEQRYPALLRVGAAGGISTPWATAAAFAMGAAYVVTGSVNQACLESGTSDAVRRMLADVKQSEVAMAPAADMFEMGVKVQVLKRGTMFPMRAAKLYELYRQYGSIEELPAAERANLEKTVFRTSLDSVWSQTRAYFQERDPKQIDRAEGDPKHKLALVFRWYLGQSSHWANAGVSDRLVDYQVWCGPAMAAFNDWVRGSFLERPESREADLVALNLLYGAAVALRAQSLRMQGFALPPGVPKLAPLTRDELAGRLATDPTIASPAAAAVAS